MSKSSPAIEMYTAAKILYLSGRWSTASLIRPTPTPARKKTRSMIKDKTATSKKIATANAYPPAFARVPLRCLSTNVANQAAFASSAAGSF